MPLLAGFGMFMAILSISFAGNLPPGSAAERQVGIIHKRPRATFFLIIPRHVPQASLTRLIR
jgi:hypothetical protein